MNLFRLLILFAFLKALPLEPAHPLTWSSNGSAAVGYQDVSGMDVMQGGGTRQWALSLLYCLPMEVGKELTICLIRTSKAEKEEAFYSRHLRATQ